MKQILTAKLKLQTSPEQFRALRQTQLAYRDALNHVSRYAFEHGKMSSGRALQRDCDFTHVLAKFLYHMLAAHWLHSSTDSKQAVLLSVASFGSDSDLRSIMRH